VPFADAPQVIPIGKRKFHRRKIGDILDPFREPGYVLAELKASDGPDGFFCPLSGRPLKIRFVEPNCEGLE
jgi:hypothetical protein